MKFNAIIEGKPLARDTAISIRRKIFESFPDLDESISGGATVKNAFYSYNPPTATGSRLKAHTTFVRVILHYFQMLDYNRLTLHDSGNCVWHVRMFEPIDADVQAWKVDIAQVFKIISKNSFH